MQLGIAICTHNRAHELAETLAGLARCLAPQGCSVETIVVANACSDHTAEVCRAADVRMIAEPQLGLSHARNAAIATLRADSILWLDDDVTPSASLLTAYGKALQDHPGAAFFGGPIRPVLAGHPPDWAEAALRALPTVWSGLDLGDRERQFDTLSRNEYPFGANMLVRRRAVCDGFRADLGRRGAVSLLGGEDREFFRRLASSGEVGRWIPAAAVDHRIGARRQSLDYVARYFRAQGEQSVLLNGAVQRLSASQKLRQDIRLAYESILFSAGRSFIGPERWLVSCARRNKVIGMKEASRRFAARSTQK